MTTWVWIDGKVQPGNEASIAALDHGVTVGDGVFETAKVVGGEPFAMRRHLARLRTSAAIVGLDVPWSDDEVRAAAAEVIGAAGVGGDVGRLRVTLTGGPGPLGSDRDASRPTLILAAGPGSHRSPVTDVVTVEWVRNERSATAGAKTTSYAENVVALARAHEAGASEAIMANTIGALSEGTGSNVFLVVDDVLCTPALGTGCLAGITRALVLEVVDVAERDDLTLDDLRSSREAFLTSSTRDVQPIEHVDGRPLAGAPGPRTTAAAAAFARLATDTLDP
ncbi:MAG: ilvE3 [Acidimicrobiales bacterium]|nr:ilvE3 [Acidimicrobiales bacterium]